MHLFFFQLIYQMFLRCEPEDICETINTRLCLVLHQSTRLGPSDDNDDDDVLHRLFYTNLSSVVRKLSSASKAFLPHRSGGRRLGTGQTETNLLLRMLNAKIIFSGRQKK